MATDLPTNIDSTYADRSPGDAEHQAHHDAIHAYTNSHDAAPDPHGDRAYTDEKIAAVPSLTTEGFRAYLVSDQALTAATHTVVKFDTEVRDDGGDYNPATGTWTVPADGWYMVAAYVQIQTPTTGERYIVNIRINGADRARLADASSTGTNSQVAGGGLPLYLAAGNAVTVTAWRQNAGDVGPGDAFTFFTAVRWLVA